ncbi:MAG: MIP/aquaporin family protein, partial [Chthoniobacterales bacterium]
DQTTGGIISHAGVAITFGLIVLAMIHTVGDVSGAHLNPAVTLGFFAAGRFNAALVLPYLVSQSLGAIAASATLRGLFPENERLGLTTPAGPVLQTFVLEVILTFILMWVILSVSTGAKEKGIIAGIAIGSVVALEAMFAGPITGASMNPARSLGPALISGRFEHLWIYVSAPFIGAILAVLLCRCVRDDECCTFPFQRPSGSRSNHGPAADGRRAR